MRSKNFSPLFHVYPSPRELEKAQFASESLSLGQEITAVHLVVNFSGEALNLLLNTVDISAWPIPRSVAGDEGQVLAVGVSWLFTCLLLCLFIWPLTHSKRLSGSPWPGAVLDPGAPVAWWGHQERTEFWCGGAYLCGAGLGKGAR